MKSFKEYVNLSELNKLYEGYGRIDESGANLSRILKTIEDKDFVVITASRASRSKKENHKLNNEVIKAYKKEFGKEVGAYKLIGHWKECSEPLKDNETIKDNYKCFGRNMVDTITKRCKH